MNPIRVFAAAALMSAFVATSGVDAAAQTVNDLFNRQTIKEIRLFIHSKDLQEMRARYLENVYYVADLQWGRLRVRNAAVRIRGFGSRSATKPGLRIDFDRYVTNQRFLGMRSVILDNLLQDASMLREFVGMEVFARMGHPASRESFVRLFINNVDHGLYTVVEAIEPEFLARTLGENSGYLFEFHWIYAYRGEDLGDDFAPYRALLEARTHRLESDNALYSPIRELIREANVPVDAVWRERVEQYLDLRAFVSHLALNAFLSQQDGFLGYDGMNNFYLYRPARSTVHRLIPWDLDVALDDVNLQIFARTHENPLSRGALAFPDLRAHYLDVLKECARITTEDNWLAAMVLRAAELIRPAAHADRLKPWSNAQFEESVEQLVTFASTRPSVVMRAVEAAENSR
jgi:spore coat protein CotH